MSEEEKAILAANEAFYQAFANNDYATMETLWSSGTDIAVIHPGWSPLHGYRAVMDSWHRLLSAPGVTPVLCSESRVYIMGQAAFVICTESFDETELVATNIFIRENDGWKLVHHQSGPRSQNSHAALAESVH